MKKVRMLIGKVEKDIHFVDSSITELKFDKSRYDLVEADLPDWVTSPRDVFVDEDGKVKARDDVSRLEIEKADKLGRLNNIIYLLLSPTDYVITKMNEACILGGDISLLLAKYEEVFKRRIKIREWGALKKKKIKDASTIDELKLIRLDDFQE